MNQQKEDISVGDNDLKPTRTLVMDNDKEIFAFRQGPYGFWKLRYEHGMLPVKLQGEWITFGRLEQDVREFFKTKKVNIIEIKD